MNEISVLLVDDNSWFLALAAEFLRGEEDIRVVGALEDGRAALEMAPSLQPHVILINLMMPDVSGLDAIPRLRKLLPAAGIIALALGGASVYRQAALAVGADDFVAKRSIVIELLPAIRRLGHPGKEDQQSDDWEMRGPTLPS